VVDLSGFESGEGDDQLPLYYDSGLIAQYWRRRPAAVVQRIVQLTTIAGGFIAGIAMDIARKKTEENSVKRAIQLRDIVTSLGPAYIKLGQALSIRPDLLSPDAMRELQKLCDKVQTPHEAICAKPPMQPSTLNSQPKTHNPKPKTHNPKLTTQNSQPKTHNPKLTTQNSQPKTQNPKPKTQNPKPKTQNPKPKSQNPKPTTHNPQPTTHNPQPTTHNPQPTTHNPKLTTLNSQP
jgi:hypothetical protein